MKFSLCFCYWILDNQTIEPDDKGDVSSMILILFSLLPLFASTKLRGILPPVNMKKVSRGFSSPFFAFQESPAIPSEDGT